MKNLNLSYGDMCEHVAKKVPYAPRRIRERVTQIVRSHQPEYIMFRSRENMPKRESRRILFRHYQRSNGFRRKLRDVYGSIGVLILSLIINAIIRAIIDRWLDES